MNGQIILSTTDTLQGYIIKKYIDVINVISDNSIKNYKTYIVPQVQKDQIESQLKEYALKNGGNAVIGLKYASSSYKNPIMGDISYILSVHGTVVLVERESRIEE